MSDIELIDSHCHLIFENFERDLEDVVLRLRSKGVKKLVHACCELTEIPKLKKISHKFNEIYYSVGLHPLEAQKWEDSSKSLLKKSKPNSPIATTLSSSWAALLKRDVEVNSHFFASRGCKPTE